MNTDISRNGLAMALSQTFLGRARGCGRFRRRTHWLCLSRPRYRACRRRNFRAHLKQERLNRRAQIGPFLAAPADAGGFAGALTGFACPGRATAPVGGVISALI